MGRLHRYNVDCYYQQTLSKSYHLVDTHESWAEPLWQIVSYLQTRSCSSTLRCSPTPSTLATYFNSAHTCNLRVPFP